MNIIKSLEWRYACKKFDENKKVSNSQIETIKNSFNLTATSFGLQPVKLLIITNKKTKESLLEHAYYQQQITTCSHLLALCIDTNIGAKTIDEKFDLEKEIRNTSEEIIQKFREQLKGIFNNKSKQEIELSAIQQTYIILGNLMTVCAIEKIDSCPMEGFNTENFDKELNLSAKNLKSVLLLPIGFRAENDFMSKLKKIRKPVEDSVINID
ncbi:MAG: NAD(P)H-dependent oxidoreductase [Flavobacteriaceae bacterium]|nr:NAD(P)H-dependent oxidoreductase [Flavobacteriaceae bacterium]